MRLFLGFNNAVTQLPLTPISSKNTFLCDERRQSGADCQIKVPDRNTARATKGFHQLTATHQRRPVALGSAHAPYSFQAVEG
jgi:hypothetical protein